MLVEYLDAFQYRYLALVSAQMAVGQAVREADEYPLWAFQADRGAVADFIELTEYPDDEMEAAQTRILPALIGLPPEVCAKLLQVNAARDELLALLREYDKQVATERETLTQYVLRKTHVKRLHRRALLRHFVVLPEQPQAVSFFWSQSRSIRKMTVEDARVSVERLILNTKDKAQQKQLLQESATLAQLPADEIVARVNINLPQPRINVVLPDGNRVNNKIAVMPVCYPAQPDSALPTLIPLPEEVTPRVRLRRRDARLEARPVAPLAKIYRYRRSGSFKS